MPTRSVATLPGGPDGAAETFGASGPGVRVLLPRNGREAPRRGTLPASMTKKRVKVTAWKLTCERCGREVVSIEVPERCPSCTSRNWLEPAKWARPDKRTKRK